MAGRPSYAELLRDPRWQKKRLEILQRDGFECTDCGDGTKTLHVHHGYYERGFAPWDYPDTTLKTLCEDCHERTQRLLLEVHRAIALAPDHETLLGFIVGATARWTLREDESIRMPAEFVGGEFMDGVASAWMINASDIIAGVDGSVDGQQVIPVSLLLKLRSKVK